MEPHAVDVPLRRRGVSEVARGPAWKHEVVFQQVHLGRRCQRLRHVVETQPVQNHHPPGVFIFLFADEDCNTLLDSKWNNNNNEKYYLYLVRFFGLRTRIATHCKIANGIIIILRNNIMKSKWNNNNNNDNNNKKYYFVRTNIKNISKSSIIKSASFFFVVANTRLLRQVRAWGVGVFAGVRTGAAHRSRAPLHRGTEQVGRAGEDCPWFCRAWMTGRDGPNGFRTRGLQVRRMGGV